MEVSLFGLATATAAGAISFLSPCVLPLVPGYLSFVSGDAGCSPRASNRWRVLTLAASFVTGFTTVFVLLGLGSQALGGWLQHYREEANLVGGALVIAFGLSTMGFCGCHGCLALIAGAARISCDRPEEPIRLVWPSRLAGHHASGPCWAPSWLCRSAPPPRARSYSGLMAWDLASRSCSQPCSLAREPQAWEGCARWDVC